jgi:hypothetical protein
LKTPKIPYEDDDDLEYILNQNKDLFFNRILEVIDYGISKNKKKVKIFILGDTGLLLELSNSEWEESLTNAFSYFLEIEEFEKCEKCKQILRIL